MYLLILALPLASSFISGFFGRKLGEKGAGLFSSSCIVLTFLWILDFLQSLLVYVLIKLQQLC